ncbi:unnamed protein product [Cylicostephanus goldi]|uniref:Translation initiation factor beta propellor-like domain-containing protein n=1 Tax=Cylicostephanus goldi TaxID=71465 RepID=A0A3P7RC80_CYLGO|nr:unnamed protein product [Cylicostephanus goldi]
MTNILYGCAKVPLQINQTERFTAANLYVTWSPCGRYLVYGDKEDRLHVIDGRSLSTLKSYDSKTEMNEFAYHPSGKYLFVATGQGRMEVFKYVLTIAFCE